MTTAVAPILAVENLVTEFRTGGGWHPAVRDVSFAVQHNETLAIVGESGCGKSVTALSIMGLVPPANGRIAVASQSDPTTSISATRLGRMWMVMMRRSEYPSARPASM